MMLYGTGFRMGLGGVDNLREGLLVTVAVSSLCAISLSIGYSIGRHQIGSIQAHEKTGATGKKKTDSSMYRQILKLFQRKQPRMEGADTIKMVIIIHRHGARLPNKCFPRDLSWPKNPDFYENYKGHLSPVGCQMLVDTGRSFRTRYLEGSDLFKGIPQETLHKYVVAYTSNMQRTLFSAWSFLHGMFPDIPQYFSFATDRLKVNLKAVRRNLALQGKTLGIPIYIEEVARTDRLFHQYKMNSEITQWQMANVKCSPVLREVSKDPGFEDLLSKVYRMTRLQQLHPKTSYVEKMTVMKRVQTQINIARSHGLPLLPNKEGLFLTPAELAMIRKIACEIWKLLYRPALSNEKADSMGHNAASHLAHYVTQLMVDRAEGKNKLRLAAYSAHDTTILALAARLGIDIEPPEFGGYFLFELHCDAVDPDTPYVKFFYNSEPTVIPISSLVPHKLDFSHKIRSLDALPEGSFALHKMVAECQTNGMRKSTRVLRKLSKIRRPRIKSNEMQNHVLSMMSELLRGEYKMVFDMWDRVGNGVITVEDLGSAMRLMGKNPSKEHLLQLIDLVDSDNDHMLNFEDFLRMMVLCDLKDLEEDDAEDDHDTDGLSSETHQDADTIVSASETDLHAVNDKDPLDAQTSAHPATGANASTPPSQRKASFHVSWYDTHPEASNNAGMSRKDSSSRTRSLPDNELRVLVEAAGVSESNDVSVEGQEPFQAEGPASSDGRRNDRLAKRSQRLSQEELPTLQGDDQRMQRTKRASSAPKYMVGTSPGRMLRSRSSFMSTDDAESVVSEAELGERYRFMDDVEVDDDAQDDEDVEDA